MKTWLFWDYWHFEHIDNAEIRQGRPEWRKDAVYEDPTFDYLASWPFVWEDVRVGRWRMLYPGSGFPFTLMVADSEDGIHWKPLATPGITPEGGKLAANHIFSVIGANGAQVYRIATPEGGYRFFLYCVRRGRPVAANAPTADDKGKTFHENVPGGAANNTVANNSIATSEDGLNWRLLDVTFNHPGWHPDPAFSCYFDATRGLHVMMTRPGWGDRRVVALTSRDAIHWTPPEFVLEPDTLDGRGTQIYGMPVFPYEGYYVAMLWMAHFDNSRRLDRFNQLYGFCDVQLAYSFNGQHWQRGMRDPFISLNDPGLPGAGIIFPSSMVQVKDEIRIYCNSTPDLHFQATNKQYTPKGITAPSAIILYTLRRDGFMYLQSRGNWARFTSKPLVLFDAKLSVNVAAPHGEMLFQITDLKSVPLAGYTFDDCVPSEKVDSVEHPLRWKSKDMSDIVNRVIRIEMEFRNLRLYSFRGNFHFVDALDVSVVDSGGRIDPQGFDF